MTPKRRRSGHPRKDQKKESSWYRDYLTPALRAELTLHPHGRLADIFRRDFHTPFALLQKLVQLAKDSRWWRDWNEDNVCRAGKPVSSLELKVLGALYFLANGAMHSMVSRHIIISKEVHRFFEVDSLHGIYM